MTRSYKTDWLASCPVFYNQKTNKISTNINDVIEWEDVEIDPEGLNNYLDFGYSVFGQTPVKNVKFLGPNQEILIENNRIKVVQMADPMDKLIGKVSNEDTVMELIRSKIEAWEKSTKGTITIPTSGGYDSRLLNILVNDKSRIRSFSYGVSPTQKSSYEVLYAKTLSEKLNTKWEQIELGDYHNYFKEWDDMFGVSTHAHGMYHIEFYNKIVQNIKPENFLSGIIGDGWSGNVHIDEIKTLDGVTKLGYSHGMSSDRKYSLLGNNDSRLREKYFEKNREKLNNPKWRIIESMRMKILLLSYLVRVPESYGFNVYSPFLDAEVASGMLNLPEDRRCKRQWQTDFLKKSGFDFENQNIKIDKNNSLNLYAIEKSPPPALKVEKLSEIIDRKYLQDVNRVIESAPMILKASRIAKPYANNPIGTGLKMLGLISNYNLGCKQSVVYNQYLTLKPLETLLIKRDKARHEK